LYGKKIRLGDFCGFLIFVVYEAVRPLNRLRAWRWWGLRARTVAPSRHAGK